MRNVIALLVLFAISIPASGDESRRIRSNPVSLGEGDYTLELGMVDDQPTLVLRHVPLAGEATLRPIACRLNADSLPEGSEIEWSNDRIREIEAGRYQESGLFFAMRTTVDEEGAIWAGLIHPTLDEPGEPIDVRLDYLTACEPGQGILSASGIGRMQAVSILVGELTGEEPGGLTNGIVITCFCAYADGSISGARVGRFNPTYSPSFWEEWDARFEEGTGEQREPPE